MSTVVNAVTLVREHIEGERGAWTAVFATFLLWGLALLASTLLGRKIVPAQQGAGLFGRRNANATTSAATTATGEPGVRRSSFDLERAAHRIIFGQFLSVSINEHLYGVRYSIKVISWIVFSLGLFYLILRAAVHRTGKLTDTITRILDFLFMLAFLILWTLMFSIAFATRW
jgi:hypothetical protein